MKVLLLSPYDAVSHQYWRSGLEEQFPQWCWTQLCLPARYFSWRVRGNSLSWGVGQKAVLERSYDLIIATSMTDLSTLRGLVPAMAKVPTLVYFHENQFAYPVSERQIHSTVELQMLNIYTALAADRVLFNSHYNRQTFLDGSAALFKRLPDHVPDNLLTLLEDRSAVVPVPLKISDRSTTDAGVSADRAVYEGAPPSKASSEGIDCFTLVWNHRWEYDKAPDRCVMILQELVRRQLPFRIHLLGQRFRVLPVELEALKIQLGSRLGCCGYLETRQQYHQVLSECNGVLSTALHDFQGLSVLEAVSAGAIPIVPDRLSYPELFASEYRYPSDENNAEAEVMGAADHIARLIDAHGTANAGSAPSVQNLSWDNLRGIYQQEFAALVG